MNLYLIRRADEDDIDWDEYRGFVVMAASAEDAVAFLRSEPDDRSGWKVTADQWPDRPLAITHIGTAAGDLGAEPMVIQSDCKAG